MLSGKVRTQSLIVVPKEAVKEVELRIRTLMPVLVLMLMLVLMLVLLMIQRILLTLLCQVSPVPWEGKEGF